MKKTLKEIHFSLLVFLGLRGRVSSPSRELPQSIPWGRGFQDKDSPTDQSFYFHRRKDYKPVISECSAFRNLRSCEYLKTDLVDLLAIIAERRRAPRGRGNRGRLALARIKVLTTIPRTLTAVLVIISRPSGPSCSSRVAFSLPSAPQKST